MALDPESLYLQLGQLVAETPNLAGPGPITPDIQRWLGRAAVLVEAAAGGRFSTDVTFLTNASDGLAGCLRDQNAHQIMSIVHRALARAEANAPAASRGAFIPVGATFDVFQVMGKVLGEAQRDVLIVDPYMNPTVLTDFALLVPEGATVKLLSDSYSTKQDLLKPGAIRWIQQYGTSRPLEIRLTASRELHDRLVMIDTSIVWSLTQSLKDFAGRSPASVIRVDTETARLKVHAYAQIWANAAPLL